MNNKAVLFVSSVLSLVLPTLSGAASECGQDYLGKGLLASSGVATGAAMLAYLTPPAKSESRSYG